jgi:Arc/MetJ-type ribon-helix-helix transcriptional regulator
MPETVQMTVRLSDEDRKNVDEILATGAATNLAEAIRVALAEYARAVATPGPRMAKLAVGRLKALAAVNREQFPATKLEAERELLRRGYFPNGLGDWVEDLPDTTIRIPTSLKSRAPERPRGR